MSMELVKKNPIDNESLDKADYTRSLLKAAYRLELLSDLEMEQIQIQSIQLLSRQVERYTRGESSSVTVEKAQMITHSILYCISHYLKGLSDLEECIAAIRNTPLSDMFEQGTLMIREQIEFAKALLAAVQADKISADIHSYHETIDEALPGFFASYDPDFSAQDTAASIDYPLGFDRMDQTGIEYIFTYLQKLRWENEFCHRYSGRDIHLLLNGYDRHYRDLLVNVFQLLLINALGSVLLGGSALKIDITDAGRRILQTRLHGFTSAELDCLLKKASCHLCEELGISDSSFRQYISETISEFTARLRNALSHNRLESVFLELSDDREQEKICCEDGRKIDDESFRKFAEVLCSCGDASEKIALIHHQIHSQNDFVDILEADCLFGEEFSELFKSLGDTELALLCARLPSNPFDNGIFITDDEKEWKYHLVEYLKCIDIERLEKIRALSEGLSV